MLQEVQVGLAVVTVTAAVAAEGAAMAEMEVLVEMVAVE